QYLKKGPILLSKSTVDQEALSDVGYCFIRNVTTDPRSLYPVDSQREGIASMLSVGMRYQSKPVGVLRLYTEQEQQFTPLRINLVKAVAAQAAAAIENA